MSAASNGGIVREYVGPILVIHRCPECGHHEGETVQAGCCPRCGRASEPIPIRVQEIKSGT